MQQRLLLILFLLLAGSNIASAQTVPLSFFGMNTYLPTAPPTAPFYISTGKEFVNWAAVETAKGVYTWTATDTHIANFLAAGQQVGVVFNQVPGWANGSAGVNVPPTNFQDFYDFVTAVVARYKGKIQFYSPWNEANFTESWDGTQAQMLSIAQNVYTIVHAGDSNALVATPSVDSASGYSWMQTYLGAGGGAYADELDYHAYFVVNGTTQATPPPEQTANIAQLYALLGSVYMPGKPIIADEGGSCTTTTLLTDQAYVGIYTVLLAGNGVADSLWYGNNESCGNLLSGTWLNPVGVAYRVMQTWLANSTFVSTPSRIAGTNKVLNTGTTGATVGVVGSGGSVPTNWSVYNPDTANGITTSVVAIGTEDGLPYIDFRVYGTPTSGAHGSISLEFLDSGSLSAGYYTGSAYVKQTPSAACIGLAAYYPALDVNESNSSGGETTSILYYPFVMVPGIALSQGLEYFSAPTTLADIYHVTPQIFVGYTVGTPVDCTIRVGGPNIDSGSVWAAPITRGNGANSEIVWDASGGPTNYNTSAACGGSACNFWRDSWGLTHPVAGGSVKLTNLPIILDSAAQGVSLN